MLAPFHAFVQNLILDWPKYHVKHANLTEREGSIMKRYLAAAVLLGASVGFTPANASPIVWDFSQATGPLTSPHTYNSNPVTSMTIDASAFGTSGVTLFGKNAGTGEQGLGLTGNANNPDNEITPGNFVQLDISKLTIPPLTDIFMSFQANSTTGSDKWHVFGTNTPGTLTGAVSILSGNDETLQTLPGVIGHFTFLDVTADSGDILIHELDNNLSAVPLPGAIWMFGAGLGGLGLLMRRRKNKGQPQPV